MLLLFENVTGVRLFSRCGAGLVADVIDKYVT